MPRHLQVGPAAARRALFQAALPAAVGYAADRTWRAGRTAWSDLYDQVSAGTRQMVDRYRAGRDLRRIRGPGGPTNSTRMPKRRRLDGPAGYRKRYNRFSHTLAHSRCVEKKNLDSSVGAAAMSSQYVKNLVAPLQQGTDSNERIGKKIYIHRLDLEGQITLPYDGTTPQEGDTVKVALVLDRQSNNDGDPTWTDVYDDVTTTSLRNLTNTRRYQVLWSKNIVISAMNIQGGSVYRNFSIHKNLRGLSIEYSDPAGTSSQLVDNNLVLMTTAAAGANSDCLLKMRARIRFTD